MSNNYEGLIVYYFHRVINGTHYSDIQASLAAQLHLTETDREIIVAEIRRRENRHKEWMAQKRFFIRVLSYGVPFTMLILLLLYAWHLHNSSYQSFSWMWITALGSLVLAIALWGLRGLRAAKQ